jgi:flagellar biosynthesis protein FlhG
VFNLLSHRSIIVVNREPTSLTDAYATIKVMSRDYEKQRFGVIVNSAANAKEGEAIFNHLASICERFLGFSLTYLGCILQDDAVPRSIMKQEIAFLSPEKLPLKANIAAIAKTLTEWKT